MNAPSLAARAASVVTLTLGVALAPTGTATSSAPTAEIAPAAAATVRAGDPYRPGRAVTRWQRAKVATCQRHVRRARPSWAPRTWRVSCDAGYRDRNLYGYADTRRRVVHVDALMPSSMVRAVAVHEWGHAEQASWPTAKVAAFQRAAGRSLYSTSRDWQSYVMQPAELWAQARAVCSGAINFDVRPHYTCGTVADWARYRP